MRTWTLSCVPTGGSHPEPERACAELAAHPRALDPPRQACPLAAIQGAPSAALSGRLGSRQVDRTVRPGCGPAWQQLHYLLSAQR